MKIKKLAIRNIASIEKADIDFENDLKSFGDTDPASLFLITGDTGAGKTVILDCISMALYGTTPRVKGVAAKKNNSFSTREGEMVSITDIAQYTRIGISHRDECYSCLTFEGNDGVEYVSTFSLGITNRRNLRPASWSLKIGDREVIEGSRKEEIRSRIKDAIGLTYEQFSRMAMLAQGQFADFLTGGKEERERILEQLTSTGQFSRYGEAIERIFKRVKLERETNIRLIEAERKHIIDEEQENQIRNQYNELSLNHNNLKAEYQKSETILSEWNNLFTHLSNRNKYRKEIRSMIKRIDSDDFKSQQRMVAEWDATTAERAQLAQKISATDSLSRSREKIGKCLNRFDILQRSLIYRFESLKKSKRELENLNTWINENNSFKNLFLQVAAVEVKVSSLKKNIADLDKKRLTLSKCRALQPELKKKVEDTVMLADQISSRLQKERALHEELTAKRDALNPRQISTDIQEEGKIKNRLTALVGNLNTTLSLLSDITKEKTRRDSIQKEVDALEPKLLKISEEITNLRKKAEEAESRYTTMHLSVSENFNKLRIRLAGEHSHACPLCGQKKDWSKEPISDKELSHILSPLEKERDNAAVSLKRAIKESEDIAGRLNHSKGLLSAHVANLNSLEKKREHFFSDLKETCNLLYIYFTENFSSESISDIMTVAEERIKKTDNRLLELSKAAEEAEKIQGDIDKIVKRMHPLEKELTENQKIKGKAETELKLNDQTIINLSKSEEELKSLIDKDTSVLNETLSLKYPLWYESMEETITSLRQEAEQFNQNIETSKSLSNSINVTSDSLGRIEEIRDNILSLVESDTSLMSDHPYQKEEMDDIGIKEQNTNEFEKLWNHLFAEIKAEYEIARTSYNRLSTASDLLEDYYRESGNDEVHLRAIAAAEISIPEIRRNIDSTLTTLQSKKDAFKAATTASSSSLLHLKDLSGEQTISAIPRPALLKKGISNINIRLEELLKSMGSLQDRLKTNDENKKSLNRMLAEKEVSENNYMRWDLLNRHFGGTRFRTLVQSYILRPLLRNANIYLERITDRFRLTCSEDNEQLSILILDRYNKDRVRSVTVLSGGERFMISLALSLALSSMNRPDLNVDILFIDEGFGTLDAGSLNAVIDTLQRLPEIAGQNGRRVGVISHRDELADRIDVKIRVSKCGEGRSRIEIQNG